MNKYQEWQSKLNSELEFWKDVIQSYVNKEEGDCQSVSFKLDPNTEIQEIYRPYITKTSKLLDIGCGILTPLGKNLNGHRLDITAVDVLANEYNTILDDFHLEPPVRTQLGAFESCLLSFKEESFDFVLTSNALDHSHNAVVNLIKVLGLVKKDGIMYITFYENEGLRNNYEGIHGWDFKVENNVLMFTQNNRVININEIVTISGSKIENITKEDNVCFIVIRKG